MNQKILRTIGVLLIIGLGLLSLYFGVKYNQVKKVSDSYLVEKEEVNNQFDSLSAEFETLTAEFAEVEENKVILTTDLEQKKSELLEQRDKISRLLRKERLTDTELDQARAMIQELKNEKNALLTQLKNLGEENIALKTENQAVNNSLQIETQKNKVLQTKTDSLVTKTVALTETKTILEEKQLEDAPKVAFSQVIPVTSITTTGVKYKNSGKEKETTNYKKIDKIKIDFTTAKNPVAPAGAKEYIVRIISPNGTVVYDRERGSGQFTSADDKGMKYTTKTTIDYQGAEKNVSIFWRQDQAFEKGVYQVQMYHNGYEVGSSQFELD